ncbi:hypothetical protein, partial [Nocardia cyriacigeorgica]|uniref:hypothetical protein n=1 Tax=Nocardia cyriacigeorgica TaxID=135487 RepID=UPI00245481A4
MGFLDMRPGGGGGGGAHPPAPPPARGSEPHLQRRAYQAQLSAKSGGGKGLANITEAMPAHYELQDEVDQNL